MRKFLLIDNLSGITKYPFGSNLPQVLRVASEIKLKIVLLGGSDSKIYIPYMEIKYVEKLVDTSTGSVVNPDT